MVNLGKYTIIPYIPWVCFMGPNHGFRRHVFDPQVSKTFWPARQMSLTTASEGWRSDDEALKPEKIPWVITWGTFNLQNPVDIPWNPGWLIRILIMAYCNPYTTGLWIHPLYNPTNRGFEHCSPCDTRNYLKRSQSGQFAPEKERPIRKGDESSEPTIWPNYNISPT